MKLVELLLADWNIYRMQTKFMQDLVLEKNVPSTPLKSTPERMKLFADLVVWCQERQIEPRLWIFSLFKQRRWLYAPKLQKGHIMSENHIPKFQKMWGLGFFKKRMMASRDKKTFDPNRDTSSTVEALKLRYAESGQTRRCMDEMMSRTLGFHPDSDVCAKCFLRAECLVQLQSFMRFDIVALREGKLSAAEAEALSNG